MSSEILRHLTVTHQEKLSEAVVEAVAPVVADMERQFLDRARMEGTAMALAAQQRLLRAKASMVAGRCWKCDLQPSDPSSRYAQCTACTQAANQG